MITYGHEKYIKQAIESVFKQKTCFNFELIISNDNSPDNTNEIIQEFLKIEKYKEKIIYFNHKENLGAIPNFTFALSQCKGKYIAICEGDDYWIDEYKLQSQFDFLESNSNYVSCGSQIYSVNGLEGYFENKNNIPYSTGKTFSYINMALANRIPFVTAFFRNNINKTKLDIISLSPHGDWPTHIAIAEDESSLYFVSDKKTAVYRLHEGGIYSMQKNEIKQINTAKTLKIINELTLNKLEEYYFLLSMYLMKNWDLKEKYLYETYHTIYKKNTSNFIEQISTLLKPNTNFWNFSLVFNRFYKSNKSDLTQKKVIFNLYQETKPNKLCLLIPNTINFDYWTSKF